MKKFFLIAALITAAAIAWWLVSPLWRTVRLDEALPRRPPGAPAVRDNLDTMDAAVRDRFMQETAIMQDKKMMGTDAMPPAAPSAAAAILAQGPMIARAHDVAGTALLIRSDDETILRFEDLETINGPDLRIYLSTGPHNDDFVDVGPLRATHGNVNYALPPNTDTGKYRYALIWCRAFGVLFSYAALEMP